MLETVLTWSSVHPECTLCQIHEHALSTMLQSSNERMRVVSSLAHLCYRAKSCIDLDSRRLWLGSIK